MADSITMAVLAGGNSSRLGRNKAKERLNGKSLLEIVVNRLSQINRQLLIVTSREKYQTVASLVPNSRIVIDLYPNTGVMGAIFTALSKADTDRVFVTGCDMPFLNAALINHLVDLSPGFDAVVPRLNGMNEPLYAIYSNNCLGPIEQLIRQNKLGINGLLNILNTKYVNGSEIERYDKEHLSFFNINTCEDLEKARLIAGIHCLPNLSNMRFYEW